MPDAHRGPWGQEPARQGQTPTASPADDPSFRPLSPGIWQDREPPRRDWMVENAFLRGTVGLICGDGGIGKSLLMQQLVTCAVLGRPWLGMSLARGAALYLACEDDQDELWRRQANINRSLGCEMADLDDSGLCLAPRVGQDNGLIRLDRGEWRMKPTGLMNRIANYCRQNGKQYVVLDTATHVFRGNQNDETQVVDFISELRRLAIAIQGIVLITKHPSMAGRALGTGESGNVAWNNSVRSRLYVYQRKDETTELRGMKSNYSRKLDKIELKFSRGVFEKIEPLTINYYDTDR